MLSKATLVTYFVITVFTFEPPSIHVFAYVYSFHPCEKIEMYIGHTWVWVLHHVWHVCAQAQLLFVQLDNSLITTIFDTIMCWEFMYSYLSFTSSLKVTFITIVLNSFISLICAASATCKICHVDHKCHQTLFGSWFVFTFFSSIIIHALIECDNFKHFSG